MRKTKPTPNPKDVTAYGAQIVRCQSATREDDRTPGVIMTVSMGGQPMSLFLNMAEARKLAASVIVSLAAHDDLFADRLLYEHFPYQTETGEYHWPAAEDCAINHDEIDRDDGGFRRAVANN